ncbi:MULTISPECIES: pyruvate dehydrogenase complex dihydrolipoamide acetyltransferase [Thalassospira]|uniref:pyruvate dehydrogenase complex dihydrolipoamide acetyltransferase n=1 Tax=Thalassospira TaxID=168934 RepID=UPI0008DD1441|nr:MULTISPECIES: pyruvate dehydrogenase complex dihydrolipoamide acetyltransferase [Thalassospira]MAB32144.1 pyruvate dehydrogenase complex dihydrolipoamide acetyltransferase [Thalassospira sp.]MDM7975532.1 pyruvate dehydrogenase complex dihydrolipoamide acetyltransferase [Thalassospira xiamenensis]OHZ00711.1 pyruvate dehydrogenase complex dihydrolipoamide acetyltransferase [Thalassospira sp. MIT1004]HBS23547.1 pyruvate dehydrogenase complex dihydrolipoamide acetyltransferase [Thalassospira sp.
MPVKILMPALSPTMTEGTLAKWLVKEGDTVESGDVIAEIETDKATMEVEAVDEGKIGKILVSEGSEGVAVNEVIALLLEEGEDASALDGADTSSASVGGGDAEPAAEAPKQEASKPEAAPAKGLAPAAPVSGGDRIKASPLARRIAANEGVDLGKVEGSGPRGRVVKRDVEAALSSKPADKAASAATSSAPAGEKPAAAPQAPAASGWNPDLTGLPEYEEIPNSSMRKVIARRLTQSKQQVPHFYLTVDCELDNLLATRKQLNEKAGEGVKVSVNDFVIRAASIALKRVPAANAVWTDAAILQCKQQDISVAVAIEGGLITPVIRNAGGKGLAEISTEMKALAGKAREGKLKPEEFQGGTFSVSNLGMFGIKEFSAIINPPQGCILAVGAGEQRAVVKDGALAIATVMSCTLSVDHRVVDGAIGAEFMAEFKKLIEDPLSMLL